MSIQPPYNIPTLPSVAWVEETQEDLLVLATDQPPQEFDPLSSHIRLTAGKIDRFSSSTARLDSTTSRMVQQSYHSISSVPEQNTENSTLKGRITGSSLPKSTPFSQRPGFLDAYMTDKAVQNVATARVTAAALELVGEVVVGAVKTVVSKEFIEWNAAPIISACNINSTTKKVCKSVVDFSKKAMNQTAEAVKEFGEHVQTILVKSCAHTPHATNVCTSVVDFSKKTARVVSRFKEGPAIKARLIELGVPASMAQQFVQDGNIIGLNLVFTAAGYGAVKLCCNPSVSRFIADESGAARLSLSTDAEKKVQKIFAKATRLPEVSHDIPMKIDVHSVMDGNIITDFGIYPPTHLTPLKNFTRATLCISEAEFTLKSFYTSGSGNRVFKVIAEDKSVLGVLKEVIAVRSPERGFFPEIVSLEFLRQAQLARSSLPELIGIGTYENGTRGLLMYSYIPHPSLHEMLNANKSIPMQELGGALAEINSITSYEVPTAFLEEKSRFLLDRTHSALRKLKTLELEVRFTDEDVKRVIRDAFLNPGPAGWVHGDAHPGNFLVGAKKPIIIDTGSLMESIDRLGTPYGIASFDRGLVMTAIQDFADFQAVRMKSTLNFPEMIAQFDHGYQQVFNLTRSAEAEKFSRLFWEMFALDCPYDPAVMSMTARRIEAMLAPSRIRGTTIMSTESQIAKVPPKKTKVMASRISSPTRSEKAVYFLKDECGAARLPLESDFYIKLFKLIGYHIVKGGKGSHRKLRRPNSPMMIIPNDKILGRGTANNIMRVYDLVVESDAMQSASVTQQLPKATPSAFHSHPLPHRINYSHDFLDDCLKFVNPKEFIGVLKKDLLVVQYQAKETANHKWYRPVNRDNPIDNIAGATVAIIPAGEPVRFLHGRLKQEIDGIVGVQYRFFDFDPKWVV